MNKEIKNIIEDYEVLFAVRAGITLMIPKTPLLDESTSATFCAHAGSRDIILKASGHEAVIPNIKPEHLAEALERGSMMIYEVENDEVVRCTPAKIQKN